MISITSLEQFRKLKSSTEGDEQGLVVHFGASWCEPCPAISDFVLQKIASLPVKVSFFFVDCSEHSEISEEADVDRVPFLTFYRKISAADSAVMEPVANVSGGKLDEIEMNLVSLYTPMKNSYQKLDEYLTFLTKRPGIVLFITGTPSLPRCGFTGQLCRLMSELKASYVYYDVMGDDEVCQALKTFSDWPTYPQVYVDGELIGGWDICKSLHENGELKTTLKIQV